MIRALKSSWWVHLPGLIAIAAMVTLMAARRPWPSRAPVHFDFHFQSDQWGSPWEVSIFPLLATWIVVAGMAASAVWARQEKGRKRFNLTLPLLVTPLGAVAGVHLWYWWNLRELAGTGSAPGAWTWIGICAFLIAASSVSLEIIRKAIPNDAKKDIAAKLEVATAEQETPHKST